MKYKTGNTEALKHGSVETHWKSRLTFLLLLGPSSLVLLDAAGAVGANRGAVDAGVLLLRVVIVHFVTLTGQRHSKKRAHAALPLHSNVSQLCPEQNKLSEIHTHSH